MSRRLSTVFLHWANLIFLLMLLAAGSQNAPLVWAAIVTLAQQFNLRMPGPDARSALLTLMGTGVLHGCFHLWRASAFNDGALRRMLP